MMFTEGPCRDRCEAAAQAGFTAVEYFSPYEYSAKDVGDQLRRNGLTQGQFNTPHGDWDAGERGFASLPDRFADLQHSLHTALPYAQMTGVKRVHLVAGGANHDDPGAVTPFSKS